MTRVALALGLVLVACGGGKVPASRPPTAPAPAAHDALDLHYQAVRQGMQHEGLTPGALEERGFLPPGGRAAYPVRVAPRSCAMFVALATSNVADLDAAIYTAEGVGLVEDDGANARPTLTLCAEAAPITGYLTLHAYQGAGSYIAAQFTRPAGPNDDLQTVAHGRAITALGQLAQTLHERGFEDIAPRVSLTLGDARPVRLAVNVDAGTCYTLAAEGSEGLSGLSLRLVDPEGGELANGLGEPQLAAVQYCATHRAELALEVSAQRGQGVASVGRFRAAQAAVGGVRALWLGEPTPTAAAWAAEKRAAPTSPLLRPATQMAVRQGEVIELPKVAARGACQRWELTLAPGLFRATLRVESDDGALLGEAETVRMRACVLVCGRKGVQRVTVLGRAGFGTAELRGSYLTGPVDPPAGC